MNAVVLTVKSSYVASTKYPRQGVELQKVIFDMAKTKTVILF